MLKEKIYAWYPQVDVLDYTAAKPDSYEIECLYRQVINPERGRAPKNNVPTIGFRISQRTAQEEEEELSPVEFLKRCKSAPLIQLQPSDESPPHQFTKNDTTPKPETKSFLEVPKSELPESKESPNTDSAQLLQCPRPKSSVVKVGSNPPSKVRPNSACLSTGNRSDMAHCTRKLWSARTSRHVKVQRPVDSPAIVVTPPDQVDGNAESSKSSPSKSTPRPASSMPAPRNSFPNSDPNRNVAVGPRSSARSFSARTYRPKTTSADGRARGDDKRNSSDKENLQNNGNIPKSLESANRSTGQKISKSPEPNNPQHQIGGRVQNDVLQDVSISGRNVIGLEKKNKRDNSQIEVPRSSEKSIKSASASKKGIRDLAIKEIGQYDSENYERSLRVNGWRMELQGNKFGLKKTPVRLPYWVPLGVPKVPDRPPVFRTTASSTFFYNTIPSRPKRVVIAQNWHSEVAYEQRLANINRKKRGYHYRNWSFVY